MTAPTVKPTNTVRATWRGGNEFDTGRVGAPLAHIDSKSVAGQSPPELLLSAFATCAALDVLDFLAKRRTPAETLVIDVVGERRETHPRRFMTIDSTYHITGAGIERVHAERAVAVSIERYCSVAASLAPDIVAHSVVVLNGERGERVRNQLGL